MADMLDKTVLFLAIDGLDAKAFEIIWDCFGDLDASTRIASSSADEEVCDSTSLLSTHSDMSFADAAGQNFDVIVIADGATANAVADSLAGKTVILRAFEQNAALVSVGEGALALIASDVVSGLAIAGPPSLKEPLANAGAMLSNEPLAASENIFSARDSQADLKKLCLMASDYITSKREAA
ncbi:MAG: hypothetical protein A2074_00565 [Candidatus Aquicultor primus]|uniref:DJ-1/PfpI domain-containing protein n=1 Tax=Candidatus Aquicultor primus TaxID=1797195 RepID=A0A1F2UJC6_9ACTN|nr:MAG: hypothetical protein A2074_00565 [Candidatus Aquicultor primus]